MCFTGILSLLANSTCLLEFFSVMTCFIYCDIIVTDLEFCQL